MKLNRRGYMLVEIIVAFGLAFSIAMYLLNLTIKFKDTNDEVYYSARYLKDKNLITRNIMDDFNRGIITDIIVGNNSNFPYVVNFEMFIDGVTENRKLKIDKNEDNLIYIEYGKIDDGNFVTGDDSYYKKALESSLIVDKPKLEVSDGIFSLILSVSSIYDDESYDIKLITSCYSISYMTNFTAVDDYRFYRSDEYRDKITKVSFVNYVSPSAIKWDISVAENPNEVIAWLEENGEFYNLYIGSENVIGGVDLSFLFANMSSLQEIDFSNLETMFTENMQSMFYKCESLNNLDLSDFNTSNVNDMNKMFYYAGYSSTSFLLSLGDGFDTSNVTQMGYMFSYIANNIDDFELDLTSFNFDNVNIDNIYGMFLGFKTTQKIYVKNTSDQTWILDRGFDNLSVSNVVVKS